MEAINQKTYMQQYYEKNKDKFTAQIKRMEQCNICGRSVQHQFMKRHVKTDICRQRGEKMRHNVKFQIEQLQKKIEELKSMV